MPVPNTNTFTLQDVVDEITPSANSLNQCVIESIEGKFDINYGGYPADSLYHFRNYGNYRTIQLSASGQSSVASACADTVDTNYYTDYSDR